MPDRPDRSRDHLANERTLLAWIRTGVTLIGLGFVVARFSYLLRTLAAEAHNPAPAQSSGGTALGIAMVAAGAATILLALFAKQPGIRVLLMALKQGAACTRTTRTRL